MSRPPSRSEKALQHLSLDEQVMNESWTETGSPRAGSGMVRSSTFDVLCRDDGRDKMVAASNTTHDSSVIQSSTPTPTKYSRSQKAKSAGIRRRTVTLKDDESKQVSIKASGSQTGGQQSQNSVSSAAETSLFQFFVGMEKGNTVASDQTASDPVDVVAPTDIKPSDGITESRSGLVFYDIKKEKNKGSFVEENGEEKEVHRRRKQTAKKLVETSEQVILIVTEDRVEKCRKALSAKDESDEEEECATPVNASSSSRTSSASHRTSHSKRSSHRLSSSSIMSCSWTENGPRSMSQTSLRKAQQRPHSPTNSYDYDSEMSMSMSSSLISTSVKRSSSRVRSGQEEDRLARQLKASTKLGEDLLRMLLKEVETDVEISIQGRTIKAHAFMLCSRSPYFRSVLRGEPNSRNKGQDPEKHVTIQMNGITFQAIHFALCHMYTGSIILPKDPSMIPDLAVISDLLQLNSLTDTIVHELTVSYCHTFHKPCKDCSTGVLDCLILADSCHLLELKGKCLDWLARHFTRIWPTKAFASLSRELIDECFVNTAAQFTPDNVIDTILACERLSAGLPRVKWAETVFDLVSKLQKDASLYITGHYDAVIENKSFTGLSRGRDWNVHAIEEMLILAISDIDPDVACKALLHLSKYLELSMNTETGFGYGPYSEAFVTLVKKLIKYTERQIVHFGPKATSCPSWELLPLSVQNRINDSALIVYEFDKPIKPLRVSSAKVSDERTGNQLVRNMKSAHKTARPSSAGNSRCDDKPVTPTPHSTKGVMIADQKKKSKSLVSKKTLEKKEEHNGTPPNNGVVSSCKSPPANHASVSFNRVKSPEISEHIPTTSRIPGPGISGGSKKSQVAKVSPFNLKTNSRDGAKCDHRPDFMSSSLYSKRDANQDLMAEMEADSSMVHSCLQEAEALEAVLTRKLHHYQNNFCKDLPAAQSGKPTSRRKVSLPTEVRNPIPAFIGPNVPRTRTGLVPTSPKTTRKVLSVKSTSRSGSRSAFK